MVITKLLACDTEPLISSYEDIARHLTDRSFAIFNLGPSLEPLLIFTRVGHRLDFRLKMSVAKSGSIVHTEEWKIENFDDAMKPGRGVKSDGFHISGVPGEFQLVISPSWKTVKLKEFEAKHLFLVNLTFTSVDKDLKAAGMLELVKEGEERSHSGESSEIQTSQHLFQSTPVLLVATASSQILGYIVH